MTLHNPDIKCITEKAFMECDCPRCIKLREEMIKTFYDWAIGNRIRELTYESISKDVPSTKKGCGRKFAWGWTCSDDGKDNHKLCPECRASTKNEVNSQDKTGITEATDIVTGSFGSSSPDIHSQLKDEMQKDYTKGKENAP